MKNIITSFFFIVIVQFAFAKAGFKIGVGAGVNVCKIKQKYYSDRNSNMVGFDVAIPMEIKISQYFAIQPEIHFLQKGFSLKAYGIGGIEKEFRRRNFIEFPILLKGLYTIKEKSTLSFFTGVGVGYALSNKQVLKFSDGHKETNKLPFDTDISDGTAYNKIDVTIPIGFGYEYKLNDKISIYTDMRWNLDITNNIKYLNKTSTTPYYKYRNFIFSVGIFYIAKSK